MSNWCLGCGKTISRGDWCPMCKWGLALDPKDGLVPIPIPPINKDELPREQGIKLPRDEDDDDDIPF